MPTWDELKARRDGSLNPLIATIEQPAGEAAYILGRRRELAGLRRRLLTLEEKAIHARKDADDADAAESDCRDDIESIEEELEGMGVSAMAIAKAPR